MERRIVREVAVLLLSAAVALSAAACSDKASSAGKGCQTIADCPPDQFCAITRVCVPNPFVEESDTTGDTPDGGDPDPIGDDPTDLDSSDDAAGTDDDGDLPVGDDDTDPSPDTDTNPDVEPNPDTNDQPSDGDPIEGDGEAGAGLPTYESLIVDCPRGTGTGPRLAVFDADEQPVQQVDFGAVRFGQFLDRVLILCNAGSENLGVAAINFAPNTPVEFSKQHQAVPITVDNQPYLPPGKGVTVALYFYPEFDNDPKRGTLNILSSDPARPQVEIPLLGSVKAAGRIRVRPQVVQFFNQGGQKVIAIDNVGSAPMTIAGTRIENPGHFTLDRFSPAQTAPFQIQPGGFVNAVIVFDGDAGAQDTRLLITWNDGEGEFDEPVRLVRGGQSQCAVPNGGPDQQVRPLSVVTLDASLSNDPNDAQQPGAPWYRWEWQEKPDGAATAVITDQPPNPANGALTGRNVEGQWIAQPKVYFFAELAGRYVARLRVNPNDDVGCASFDLVEIRVNPDETVHIQLRWDTPGNDHDLHLVRPNGFFTRTGGNNAGDCHYANCNTRNGTATPCPTRGCPGPNDAPDWAQAGVRADDPTLDIDDIAGVGPENINLSLPETGDYLVITELFSGGGNVQATTKIWLFGVLQGTFRNRIGASNRHWIISVLRVHSPTDIEVLPVGLVCNSNASGTVAGVPQYTCDCRGGALPAWVPSNYRCQ